VDPFGVQQGADLGERFVQVAVVLTVDPDVAGGGGVQAEDHPHGGGLAGPVRAQEAGHLAGFDLERQVVNGNGCAVSLGEALCLDHRRTPRSGGALVVGRAVSIVSIEVCRGQDIGPGADPVCPPKG